MTTSPSSTIQLPAEQTRAWRVVLALGALALTSFSLVTAEFLPGGIITDLAQALGVTVGQAGQTITVTAFVGFLVAPTIGIMTPGVDRRTLLVVLAVAAALSNLIVAFAPSLWVVLIARFLLGAALSGFWSMSLAVAVRVGGEANVGRSMTVVNGGTTLATVAGVPLGVLGSHLFGWQFVFVAAAVLTVVTAIALRVFLPPIPAERSASLATLGEVMMRRGVRQGLGGHVLIVFGHFAAYAFARVALERNADLDASGIAFLLVVFGLGGVIGNLIVGALARRHLTALRWGVPLLLAVSVAIIALVPGSVPLLTIAMATWGVSFGGWLVVLNAWASQQVPDRLEAIGGLSVAGFQLAITLGAGLGGLIVDLLGVGTAASAATLLVTLGTVLFASAPRTTSG